MHEYEPSPSLYQPSNLLLFQEGKIRPQRRKEIAISMRPKTSLRLPDFPIQISEFSTRELLKFHAIQAP